MKLTIFVAFVLMAGIGTSLAVFSCGTAKTSSSAETSSTTASSDGKDVTQAFTLEVTTASVAFPAGALDAGAVVKFGAADAPAEFTAGGVAAESAAIEISAVDANAKNIAEAKAPFTLAINLNDAAALADAATTEGLCVLGKDSAGTLRRWPFNVLSVNEGKRVVKFPSLWFGVFQAVNCGDKFQELAAVNAAGTEATAPAKDAGSGSASASASGEASGSGTGTAEASASTADPNCNEIDNVGPSIAIENIEGETPTGTGGTIADGTYIATNFSVYSGSLLQPGSTIKDNAIISGGGTVINIVSEDMGNPLTRETFSIAPNGIVPNLKRTCTTHQDTTVTYTSYTATKSAVTFYCATPPYALSATFTKAN